MTSRKAVRAASWTALKAEEGMRQAGGGGEYGAWKTRRWRCGSERLRQPPMASRTAERWAMPAAAAEGTAYRAAVGKGVGAPYRPRKRYRRGRTARRVSQTARRLAQQMSWRHAALSHGSRGGCTLRRARSAPDPGARIPAPSPGSHIRDPGSQIRDHPATKQFLKGVELKMSRDSRSRTQPKTNLLIL